MRFGSFVFPVSHFPENDSFVINCTLEEIKLQESLGFYATWLTEHHFDGASAYVDPVVFGAAVASTTSSIKIGFAVVEMAFHHPVRLAAQTALLDNLSGGRLIVGIGRGSAFNTYEYLGFGIPKEKGDERLVEAEELMVKSWTEEDVRFNGQFWQVSFPKLRPRPYQTPHPPMIRACMSDRSVTAMARIGRPIMMGVQPHSEIKRRLEMYTNEMLAAGFDESTVEAKIDQNWVAKNVFVASRESDAREIAEEGFRRERKHFREARESYNPEGFPSVDSTKPPSPADDFDVSFIVGTPTQVAEQIEEIQTLGVRNLMLKMNVGEMDIVHVQRSIKMFGEKIIPVFN